MNLLKSTAALTAFAALALTAACSSEGASERSAADAAMLAARTGEEVRNVCFPGNIDSFSDTTKKTVVVRTSPRDQYLLTTAGCYNLENALSLEIENRSGCLTKGDYIVAYDSVFGDDGTGIKPTRCVITRINKWKEPEAS